MSAPVQRRVFTLVVLLSLALLAFFGLVVAQPALIGGLAGDPSGGHVGEHFREAHHRVHDLAFGLLLGTTAVGMVVQQRAPAKNVAGQLMAATPIVALMLAAAASGPRVLSIPWVAVGAPTIVATMLHPYLFGAFGTFRPSRRMLFLVAIAAAPFILFAMSNLGLQRVGSSDHADLGHYGYMAALGFAIIGVGLVSSLRLEGWRLTAWVAGGLSIALGSASLVFQDVEGSLGVIGALAAITWGLGFTVVAEFVRRGARAAS
jgi:hypothetical protein